MKLDAKAVFANLADQERIKGHHSPEGRAIRTLSRALHGWSSGHFSAGDAVVLCDQAMEEWLKTKLGVSPWSAKPRNELLRQAERAELLTRSDAAALAQLHDVRISSAPAALTSTVAEEALKTCIDMVEKHWE